MLFLFDSVIVEARFVVSMPLGSRAGDTGYKIHHISEVVNVSRMPSFHALR